MDKVEEIVGEKVLFAAADGPLIAGPADTTDLLGEAFSREARTVVLPVERLDPQFLVLSTRIAGEVIQRFTNYGLRVVILGNVSAAAADSEPLKAFIRESNRGEGLWFVDDLDELRSRLAR